MEMVKERVATETSVGSREAQEHNAQIRERYLRLQSMEAEQFASEDSVYTPVETRNIFAPVEERAYPSAFSIPTAQEQAPQVTEFVNHFESPVFTTEKFERFAVTEEPMASTYATPTYDTYAVPTFEADVTTQKAPEQVATVQEASYQLSLFAKLAIGLFATVVIALLTWIGFNSRALDQKSVQLHNLEMQKQALIEDNAEIQRRIAEAKSEETIREYAQSQGIVLD